MADQAATKPFCEESVVQAITQAAAARFRSFGGGNADPRNPISIALQGNPPQFAGGVDIAEVVRFVLLMADVDTKRLSATINLNLVHRLTETLLKVPGLYELNNEVWEGLRDINRRSAIE